MKIVALTENTTETADIAAEHGLSLYIEANGQKILFDMGQTESFYKNAITLGISLSEVDIAILSHGHYDHGGGLKKFLEINKKAPVYISEKAFEPYYNGTEKYIGLDIFLKSNPRLVYVKNEEIINTNLAIYSCNNKERPNFLGSFGLTKKIDEAFIPDDFAHEQYLLIEDNGKRILMSGCSHKGIIDIVNWFEPDFLVGGFHLSKITENAVLDKIADALSSHNTQYFTCHCTGEIQYEYLKKKINRLEYLSCGKTVII